MVSRLKDATIIKYDSRVVVSKNLPTQQFKSTNLRSWKFHEIPFIST